MPVLDLLEFPQPGLERAIDDQLDILPADDLIGAGGAQASVAGLHIDDLRCVQAYGLANDGAPALLERFTDNARVGARRSRGNDKRIGQLQAIHRETQVGHGILDTSTGYASVESTILSQVRPAAYNQRGKQPTRPPSRSTP